MARGLSVRARIAAGSLVVAGLLAVPAAFVLNAQIGHIVRLGSAEVLRSDQAPFVSDIEKGRDFNFPGPDELIAVVAPDHATPVDTLPISVRLHLTEVLEDDETKALKVRGTVYLVRSTPVEAKDGTWHVVAAREGSAEDAVLGPMRLLLAIVLVIVVLGVAVGAWLLAALSLRPVSRLRATAARLSTGEGDELLPVGAIDDEISRLARTLNALIERLRAATDRERQLVSDASHELRTPLAVVRTQLELARSGNGDADSLRRDIAEAERGALRLQRLLGSLLELSAIESGAIESGDHGSRSGLAEAVEEVRDAVDRASFRADGATLTFRTEQDPRLATGTVRIAAEDLGRVVDNLLSNSLAALAGRAGTIDVVLSVNAVRVRLEVADDAGGLDEDVADTATRRFTRGRSAVRGTGAGLGLPIVAALVQRAGGSLDLANRPGAGLTVAIDLPVFG